MTKQEFLEKLKQKLDLLTDMEVKDILDEYSDTIDQKVQEGKSEEEAVNDFGDINELVDEIYDAYKIKGKKESNKHQDTAGKAGEVLNDIIDSLSRFFSTVFKDLTVEGLSKTLVLIGVGLVVLLLLRIPFAIIEGLFRSFIHILLPNSLAYVFSGFISVIVSLIFLVLSIVIIISFIRVGVNGEEINTENLFKRPLSEGLDSLKSTKKKTTSDEVKEESKENSNAYQYEYKAQQTTEQKSEEKSQRDTSVKETRSSNNYFGKSIVAVFVWILRFFGILLMIPLWCAIVGLGIAVGLIVYLLLQGVSIWGVFLLVIGAIGIVSVIIRLALLLVFNKKISGFFITMNLVIAAICIGIGMPLTLHDISRFDIVYMGTDESQLYLDDDLEIIGKLSFNENVVYDFSYSENVTFVADDTLQNELIVEAYDTYDYYLHVSDTPDKVEVMIYRDHYRGDFYDFRKSLSFTIDTLQDGKISGYDSRKIKIIVRYPANANKFEVLNQFNQIENIVKK